MNSKICPTKNYNIQIDHSRDALLSEFGKTVLKDRYLSANESFQDLFARIAIYYSNNQSHAQRLYNYISQLWFMPATPILSNGGTDRGLPISCFLNEAEDDLTSIVDMLTENVWLASRGGGVGSNLSNIRAINEPIANKGHSAGIIPFSKVIDSLTLAISQGSIRRGSTAIFLHVSHPEIEEFIDLRRPTGGDVNRRTLNLHHGVMVTDKFMHAVEHGLDFDLISPMTKKVTKTIKARELWVKLLVTRVETGEPYIVFIDTVNRYMPQLQKQLGLTIKTSNLCSEITLPTGLDHLNNKRTAVCCLSSLNLEYFDSWHQNQDFIPDIMFFLDNVLEDFIHSAPESMKHAKYSAMRERSVGLGVMGFHSFLQLKNIPLESVMTKVWNDKIFSYIHTEAQRANLIVANERSSCLDAQDAGVVCRFSNTTAVAPTASISIIAGNSSPGIEPYAANAFLQKTLSGSFAVYNKYLLKILEDLGRNTQEVWNSIICHEGSVQHLDFLPDHVKDVYKTAHEIDQNYLVALAAQRAQYISQSQSFNVFVHPDISKEQLHAIHFRAWKMGVKSMYYCRSKSIGRAEKISIKLPANSQEGIAAPDFGECLACQ
ncbi:Ribonucleoside-diphosphate reductase subunit alpha [Rickettsiales endosymbiont of Paramecium tredecaurelia]|uniref:ribonucleoside-diphosphate reductase subunit alpha n=1 Tax=Candidatus Sarmatiella mevalonica TaxID=2770581 RepID=UPI001923CEC3|nr:ribonucleoside-diphosphate reductase subunit alpha [Candidatus Sarmatiella mevalonica]MBL3284489.1 Ribonucleoside-diphosphate reductase subunit alpha [Candidatus Sarmatiella mevalonica]